MNLLSLDLEFNRGPNGMRIISAGVYIFKRTGETLHAEDIIINPNETLDPFIIELTGLTQENVDSGISVSEAFERTVALREKHQCLRMPIVWGAGYSNDSHSFSLQATGTTGHNSNPLGNRIIDVKSVWQMRQALKNSTVKGGLFNSLTKAGIGWSDIYGANHNSLADAYNTARMFMFLGGEML
jgi:inhibitor of KinA sporulation pathway (predicted exonuclease)